MSVPLPFLLTIPVQSGWKGAVYVPITLPQAGLLWAQLFRELVLPEKGDHGLLPAWYLCPFPLVIS